MFLQVWLFGCVPLRWSGVNVIKKFTSVVYSVAIVLDSENSSYTCKLHL